MDVRQNVSLKPYNTFGIDESAEYFIELSDADLLEEITTMPRQKHILGGGSNILLTQPVKGVVILNRLKGITIEKEDKANVWLRVHSGEIWHDLVLYVIDKGWGGIENLALIPGTVGASPIQNIGAYGVEIKETIESVSFWYWKEKMELTYKNRECNFGYRDSIFKHQLKDKAFVTSVVYKLKKKPEYNITYGVLEKELEQMGANLSVKAVAHAVMNIRKSKLPDPKVIGNAGSFFKNPTIARHKFDQLHAEHPSVPFYEVSDALVKIPAAWLIEQSGWKGYRMGETGVHQKQALVLVNYGNANGSDLWKLAGEIVSSVKRRFDIELEREVQVW